MVPVFTTLLTCPETGSGARVRPKGLSKTTMYLRAAVVSQNSRIIRSTCMAKQKVWCMDQGHPSCIRVVLGHACMETFLTLQDWNRALHCIEGWRAWGWGWCREWAFGVTCLRWVQGFVNPGSRVLLVTFAPFEPWDIPREHLNTRVSSSSMKSSGPDDVSRKRPLLDSRRASFHEEKLLRGAYPRWHWPKITELTPAGERVWDLWVWWCGGAANLRPSEWRFSAV